MSDQHGALVASLSLFLERSSSSRVFLVAGIHTSRLVLASFFNIAASAALVPDEDGIFENNVITGAQRVWAEDRGSEDSVERKQWLVVTRLRWSANDVQSDAGTQSKV
jgi:nicotinamide N-methyltransferase